MSIVTCDKCGDPVEVTADSVKLPFVCSLCEETIQKFHQDADAIREALTENEAEVAEFYEKTKPASAETTEPTEEFATVENTTRLIEDLETQLAVAKERGDDLLDQVAELKRREEATEELNVAINQAHNLMISSRDRKIAYFEKTLCPSLRADLDKADESIRNLQEKNDWQRQQIERMTDYGVAREKAVYLQAERIRVLEGKKEFLRKFGHAIITRLQKEINGLGDELAAVREKRNFWRDEAVKLADELALAERPWYVKLRAWARDTF